ncbi:hypothetical protein KCP70_16760 [Salmonella enterica subsp. enterica]|nr:hypothetical protein KCP70_16760 [Salmonella enterica subsp. enterica]
MPIAGQCWRCRRAECRYDNDGAGEMLNPSSAAGSSPSICILLALF